MKMTHGKTVLVYYVFSLCSLCLGGECCLAENWPDLVQKPYAKLPTPDLGLRPLLVTSGGKKITTKAEWEQARLALRDAWLARLGKPPAKPDGLDVRLEQTEELDGYLRRLVSFRSEGDDRIRAYLLTPAGLRKDERRPAVVVFHQTTRDTLEEPVGLGKKPELALALHLVRRGYVTLSPECYILKDKDGWAKGQAAALAKRRPGWTGLGKMTFARRQGSALRAGVRAALPGRRLQRRRYRPADEQLDRSVVPDRQDEASHPRAGEPSGNGAGGAAAVPGHGRRRCRWRRQLALRQRGAPSV